MGFVLGQRVRVSAKAKTAYDEIWYRSTDEQGRPTRESYPNGLAELGYECVHRPEGEQKNCARCLWRLPFDAPREGVIIGRTYRSTGHWEAGGYDYDGAEPNYLSRDRTFALYEVALSLNRNDRVLALVDDILGEGEEA